MAIRKEMQLECYKFEIQIDHTSELKELELIFIREGIFVDEKNVNSRIREKLDQAAGGNSFKILNCTYQNYPIETGSDFS